MRNIFSMGIIGCVDYESSYDEWVGSDLSRGQMTNLQTSNSNSRITYGS